MAKIILIILIILLIAWGIYLIVNNQQLKNSNYQAQTNGKNEAAIIAIENFSFSPASISIPVGKTIKWINNDSVNHSINSNDFNSNILTPGQSFDFAINKKGTYNFKCGIHPFMTGKIIVE